MPTLRNRRDVTSFMTQTNLRKLVEIEGTKAESLNTEYKIDRSYP
jgi:hypothetical protein